MIEKRKHILAIDDEDGICDSFKLALESDKYFVETAVSGEEGIEIAKKKRPDLIFLDLNIPGMGGVTALRRIREIYKDAPVYIVTAFHKENLEELQAAADEGIYCELFHKPIDANEIRDLVDNVLGMQAL